jgi:hypothetical protein
MIILPHSSSWSSSCKFLSRIHSISIQGAAEGGIKEMGCSMYLIRIHVTSQFRPFPIQQFEHIPPSLSLLTPNSALLPNILFGHTTQRK